LLSSIIFIPSSSLQFLFLPIFLLLLHLLLSRLWMMLRHMLQWLLLLLH
jgi:hypothetical protein